MPIKQISTQLIITDGDSERKLQKLNLSAEGLTQACLQGVLSRSNCTDYNTKGGPGFIQWDNTVKALRERFCGKNWVKYEYGGLEGIVSTDKIIRIIPSSGNVATGNKNQPASNKNPKGINMIHLIEKTQQLSLFSDISNQINDDNIITYVLLYYNNEKELRLELSKPASINKGKIVAWEERIIINPYDFGSTPFEQEKETEEDCIDIPILRKQN